MSTLALVVSPLYDGEFMVRGTGDVDAARAAVLEWLREDDPLMDAEEHQERVESLAPRVGWYRWNPCNERSCFDGGGHSGHLGYVDGPGRGRWQGVLFE